MLPMRDDAQGLRVLMTADAVGGVWTYAMDLASALRARGAQVTVAVLGPPMRDWHRADAAARGVEVVQHPGRLEWMADCWEDVDCAGEFLLEAARERSPDVVHLNGFSHAALPWNAPTLVVAHSCVRTWWRGVHGEDAPAEWDTYTRRVTAGLDAAGLVVAPTAALLADVQREYGCRARCRVIPNGSAAAADVNVPLQREDVVLSAGRLWDDAKNVSALCAIASRVPWPVYLAGDVEGPGGSCAYSGGAHYLGPLPPTTMAEWYRRASIYALPARYEPFGLSVVEAAAAGCALVLGDIRTLRENWSGAAVFVPPDNRRALAGAVNDLIEHPEKRRALSAISQTRARTFTVSAMTDAYAAAYRGLLAPAAAA